MRFVNRQAAVVLATQQFVDWVNATEKATGGTTHFTLNEINSEPHVYLLTDRDDEEENRAVLEKCKPEIFETQLMGWYNDPDLWPPVRTIAIIDLFLSISLHSMVIDVAVERLKKQDPYP